MGLVRGESTALLGALVSVALAAGACSQAPSANATCISAFGLNKGNGCTSNLTSLAIGIGAGAVANAETGLFGGAVAIGNKANATTALTTFSFGGAFGANATASALSSLLGLDLQFGRGMASTAGSTLGVAVGVSPGGSGTATAASIGIGTLALQIGSGSASTLGTLNVSAQIGTGSAVTAGALNLALNVSPHGTGTQVTSAGGLGTVALNLWGDAGSVSTQSIFSGAVNILGSNNVLTQGILSTAASLLGTGNTVSVTGSSPAPLSLAFTLFGKDNTLTAEKGPLSVLASFFQQGRTLTQVGPGIGIGIGNFTTPGTSAGAQGASAAARHGRVTAATLPDTGRGDGSASATELSIGSSIDTADTGLTADGDTGGSSGTMAANSGRQRATAGWGDRHRSTATGGGSVTAAAATSDSGKPGNAPGGLHSKASAGSDSGDNGTNSAVNASGGGKHRKQ